MKKNYVKIKTISFLPLFVDLARLSRLSAGATSCCSGELRRPTGEQITACQCSGCLGHWRLATLHCSLVTMQCSLAKIHCSLV